MNIIEVQHLTHIYSSGLPNASAALDDVSLAIEKGDFVGVIGHTGSGKSTLVQHLNGLLKPDGGKILLEGRDIWENPKQIRQVRFKVGLVFQYPEYQLFEETVYKDIAFGPRNMGLSEEEIKKRVGEAARFAGVDREMLTKSPFELSGGQKRRVAIAGVMAMEPEVLVLDEPAAGLDPKARDEILTRVCDYHRERGITVILVSHSMEDIARYASRVIVMNRSRAAMYDTMENVFRRSDELVEMGLAVPQVTSVFHELARRGFPVDTSVFNVEAARDEILRLTGKKHGKTGDRHA